MPTSGIVSGVPADSFSRFTFTNVALSQINSATLAQYDTVVLMEVETSALSAAQKAAIVQFVTNGGKLIIHDADETMENDYSRLPYWAGSARAAMNATPPAVAPRSS